tara:strand:+ start:7373 stop:8725 length:1353 start_codon:yes stop_codon:yes gene_type:complete
MSLNISLKRGLKINLKGSPDKVYASLQDSEEYVVKPTDFHLLTPKLVVKENDQVKAGDTLFYDKYNDKIKFSAPVSGRIKAIVRGQKRRILKVVIKSDKDIKYRSFKVSSSDQLNRDQIIETMLESGVWPFIRQRPYDVIANPKDMPKAIFISAFNSTPLSIDNDFALYGMEELFQKGINYIRKLTTGKIHLNIDGSINASTVFTSAKGVQINKFSGPHPVGNVGVQIHHIDPINKNDIVWYLDPQDVLVIARLFDQGTYDVSRIIALAGSQVKKPRYYRCISGANITNLVLDNIKDGDNRFISGDIFSGDKIDENGSLGFYHTSILVIEEGNKQEFLGWMLPGFNKFSTSRTFFSWLNPNKKYSLDANMHGEERAYVMTGEYEKVLPMDIYPAHLIKSIMVEDIELMEQLGIYEVAPEDFALCEFVCTSKINVQQIIRDGLDLLKKENS